MAEYSQIVPAIMDHFDLATASLLGHHTGALVVTEAALQFVRRLYDEEGKLGRRQIEGSKCLELRAKHCKPIIDDTI